MLILHSSKTVTGKSCSSCCRELKLFPWPPNGLDIIRCPSAGSCAERWIRVRVRWPWGFMPASLRGNVNDMELGGGQAPKSLAPDRRTMQPSQYSPVALGHGSWFKITRSTEHFIVASTHCLSDTRRKVFGTDALRSLCANLKISSTEKKQQCYQNKLLLWNQAVFYYNAN